MKKLFAILLALVLCLATLAGCSSESNTTGDADNGESSEKQSAEFNEEVVSQDDFNAAVKDAKPYELAS